MYTHVREGQNLDQALSAGAWNQMLDFLNTNPPISTAERVHLFGGANKSYLNVKNGHSVDLPEGSVLGIGDPLIDPSTDLGQFRRRAIWTGVLPTANHYGKFVVLTQPCRVNKIVRAVVCGEAITKVDIKVAGHDTCDIEVNNASNLVSGFHGSADILWKPTGTGVKWCLIRWPSGSLRWIIGTMDADISPGESKVMTVFNPSSYIATTIKETVHLKWTTGGQPISSGKQVACLWNRAAAHWLIQWADCE